MTTVYDRSDVSGFFSGVQTITTGLYTPRDISPGDYTIHSAFTETKL